MATYLSTLHC